MLTNLKLDMNMSDNFENTDRNMLVGNEEHKKRPTILGDNSDLHGHDNVQLQSEVGNNVQRNTTVVTNVTQVLGPTVNILGTAPLIVFIGPSGCGKSMVLMSLVEYLNKKNQYQIKSNGDFLKTKAYQENCDYFDKLLTVNANRNDNQKLALPGSRNEIMVDVFENDTIKYRMLEVPGEHFFKYDNNGNVSPLKEYLGGIFDKNRLDPQYPVYYVFLLDLHTNNDEFLNDRNKRNAYQDRLIEIFNMGYDAKRGDRIILLYNRFDEKKKEHSLNSLLDTYYTGIKNRFVNNNILKSSAYKLLPYISGINFNVVVNQQGNVLTDPSTGDVLKQYTNNKDSMKCAENLWKAIINKWWSWK